MSDYRSGLTSLTLSCAAIGATYLTGCSSCGTRGSGGAASSASAPTPVAAAPSASASAIEPPERRSLPERSDLDAPAMLAKRAELVTNLNHARERLEKGEAKDALEQLSSLRADDPLGAALAVTIARAANASGNFALGASAARVASAGAKGRDKLAVEGQLALGEALEKAGRPREAMRAYEGALEVRSTGAAKSALDRLRKTEATEPLGAAQASSERRFDSDEQACKSIEQDIKAGKVDLAFAPNGAETEVSCATEFALDVKTTGLKRALTLRTDVRSKLGFERLMWVLLEDPKSLLLYGPAASVFGAAGGNAVNDVVVDLQQIDVLPGGSPEIVVKIAERRTLPDVALAEVLDVDVTRAVLLTLDRGGIQTSREVTLSSRLERNRIGPKALPAPHGFDAASGLGKVNDFSMKVAWSGPNSMTLTKASGKAKPTVEGAITLFP